VSTRNLSHKCQSSPPYSRSTLPSHFFRPSIGSRQSAPPAVRPVGSESHGLFNTLSCSPTLRMKMVSPAISKVIRNLFEGRASQMFFLPSIFLIRRLGCFRLSPSRVSALRTPRFSAPVSFSYACSNCSVKRTSTATLCPQDT